MPSRTCYIYSVKSIFFIVGNSKPGLLLIVCLYLRLRNLQGCRFACRFASAVRPGKESVRFHAPKPRLSGGGKYAARWYELRGIYCASQFTSQFTS